ncbi:TetR/AcrR family transcriptional regulator [Streptomyces sp. 135]|uniref:TetR/AcrR family transcriptional regulator n=1 Tax=Streptomyces sp. 135 TaxID=2838850 RepID=UPI001CBBD96C|nr:TetR/AcrR family transcriptional regulator [Streptomyces sp. 135]
MTAARGRPRSFDRTTALERAMAVFWEQGYEATSMTDLTSAMEIRSPSLYAAFGSKEKLFLEAVALYGATEGEFIARALADEPTAREAVAAILRGNVRAYTDEAKPGGCMIVQAAANCSAENAPIQERLAQWREDGISSIARRVEQGILNGELPADTDTRAVASFYTAVLQGMSVQARDGATRSDLEKVAERAIAAWDVVTGAVSSSATG